MTIFKLFNVGPDHVEIDKTRISRPGYLSSSAWTDFWDAASEYNRTCKEPFRAGWDAALYVKRDEHE